VSAAKRKKTYVTSAANVTLKS